LSSIVLGNLADGDRAIKLDVDVLLRTRMLVQAASGQGKSHTLRRLCEQLFGKVQIFVIDHEGEFATLREKYDFAVVGDGGDAPADIRSAGLLAQKLLELGASTVFDLSEAFRKHPGDRHVWVNNFLRSMMEAPKRLWHPVVVLVDEAHKYCPEKDESAASEAMISVATDGRKRQFCLIAATQRLGKFNKDAAAELLNVMIGGTTLDIDRKRAADALGVYGKDLRPFNDEIKTIDRGLFWCLGPAISKERILVAVGAVETSPPKIGKRAAAAAPPPTKAIKALLPQLADLPQLAAEKAQTEAELRKRIRELERDVRTKPTPKVQQITAKPAVIGRKITADQVEKIIKPIVADMLAGVGASVHMAAASISKVSISRRQLAAIAASINKDSGGEIQNDAPHHPRSSATLHEAGSGNGNRGGARLAQTDRPPQPIASLSATSNGDKMLAGARRVLSVLRQWDPEQKSRDQIIVLAGVTARSLKDYLSVLRRRGYITESGQMVGLTNEGIEAAGDVEDRPQTTEDLVQYWRPKIGAGAARVLDVLVANPDESFARADLLEPANVTPRSIKDYLSILRRARLIDEPSGRVKASETLFS
jgi:hypothetical protein